MALAEVGDAVREAALCLYERHWHQSVVGIVAGRMRERYGRPVIAFADAGSATPDELKGSARSIPALHIRDAIADCAAAQPGLVVKFGGHAAAAGLTLRRANLPRFRRAFIDAVAARVSERDLSGVIVTDGELPGADLTVDNAELVARNGPWGQGFPEPVFHGEFEVVSEREVGERHLRLVLKRDGRVADAIAFSHEARTAQSKATSASTSTGTPNGSSATPMAERACCPRSPKTSSNSSEKPLMTAGSWLKPGAAFTMPNALSHVMRSRSTPSAARKLAIMPRATRRADRRASSTLTSAPTLPSGLASSPSTLKGRCPETMARSPNTRTVSNSCP